MGDVILHFDMSGRLLRNNNIGIACTTPDKNWNRGTVLKPNFLKKLSRKIDVGGNKARLYGIIIYLLLKENDFDDGLRDIGEIIICNDEKFEIVKETIERLLKEIDGFEGIEYIDIASYRKRLNRPKLKSLAHYLANAYRNRGLNICRRNSGCPLNFVRLEMGAIIDLWNIFEE